MAAASSRLLPIFRNEHLSVSRLKKFDECPRAFYFRYVNKGPEEPSGEVAAFGTLLHRTLELLYQWVVFEEFSGFLAETKLVECFREAWGETPLSSLALYNEGLAILRVYVRKHAKVDCWSILATEQEFNIQVGEFKVNGYIDRVDRIGPDHIVIVDYKSNRQAFSRDELEHDLQMSIYGLAARTLYPWAKKVSFVFHMLRHNIEQESPKTAQQINDAAGYVIALGRRTEEVGQVYPAKLNPNCGYCESRNRCDEWEKAITERRDNTRITDLKQLDDLVIERQRVVKLAKYCYSRGKELDEVLKAKLKQEGEFDAGGAHCRTIQPMDRVFDLVRVKRVFGERGVSADEVEAAVVKVGVGAVDALYTRICEEKGFGPGEASYLRVELDAIAELVPGTPKLDIQPIKSARTAKSANDG